MSLAKTDKGGRGAQVAVYMRCSTAIQAEANGTDMQRHALTLWLKGQGIDPDAGAVWFEDEGISGASDNRPAWKELLARTRAGEFEAIACYSLSRAGRSTVKLLEFTQDMQQRGVRLVFLKESLDLSTPIGRLFLTILAGLAEFEREQTAERIQAGVRAKIASKVPFGALNTTGWGAARVVDPSRIGCAKLTPERWAELFARHDAGEGPAKLARAYGLQLQYVSRRCKEHRLAKAANHNP